MNYTWGEIQITAIEKMFLNNVKVVPDDLDDMRDDRRYKVYLAGMQNAANEGLLRLMSIGRPIVKKHSITRNIPQEISQSRTLDVHTIINNDYVIEKDNIHAYYFEVNNNATVIIEKQDGVIWEEIEEINVETDNEYVVFKKTINNPTKDKVKITFKGEGHIYNVRNIALYPVKFKDDASVLPNTLKTKYYLNDIISDLYDVISIEYEPKIGKRPGKYDTDFILEGDNTLVINASLEGNFIITYQAYPDKITTDTEDDYTFTTPVEMISLLPLYIASELYKDDDITLATLYRNQFEAGLQELKHTEQPLDFSDTQGWL